MSSAAGSRWMRPSMRKLSALSPSLRSLLVAVTPKNTPILQQQSKLFSTSPTTSSVSSARLTLLRASLRQVPQHGWTQEAISAGLEAESQLPLSTMGLLTPTQLVEWFMDECQQDFIQQLQKLQEEQQQEPTHSSIPDSLIHAIRLRLELVLPYLSTWHQAMALGAVGNPVTTARQLEQLVASIEQHLVILHGPEFNAGPIQRSAIGAVYAATELHLLAETTTNNEKNSSSRSSSMAYSATWKFLEQRVYELHRVAGMLPQQPQQSSPSLASFLTTPSSRDGSVAIATAAASAVASSLVGAVVSLVQPWPGRAATTTTTPKGTSPQDYQ